MDFTAMRTHSATMKYRWRRGLVAAGLVLALVQSFAPDAHATPPVYSRYEQERLEAALRALGCRPEEACAQVDSAPEGKRIESIQVVVLEAIEKGDPLPRFLNKLHARSRAYVVERDLLLQVGDTYTEELVDESLRNLRELPHYSVVLAAALEGSAPDRVRWLVAVKDLWSLRLEFDFRLSGGRLEKLSLTPVERNLAGLQQSLGVRFDLYPMTYGVGALYEVPRVLGSRLYTDMGANLSINRDSGKIEGSNGYLSAGQPLYSVATKWGYDASVSWNQSVARGYCYEEGAQNCVGNLRLYDAAATEAVDTIPYQYRVDTQYGSVSGTRGFGKDKRLLVSFGAIANRAKYRPGGPEGIAAGVHHPDALREFIGTALPVSDTKIGPFVEIRSYENRYLTLTNLSTLGIQEDYNMGYNLSLRLFPAFEALRSSRDVIGVGVTAQYTFPLYNPGALRSIVYPRKKRSRSVSGAAGLTVADASTPNADRALAEARYERGTDGFVRLIASSQTDVEMKRLSDASVSGTMRVVSPAFLLGRVLWDGSILHRYRNYLNARSAVGGSMRLRGVPTGYLAGKDMIVSNLEFRSRPVQALNVQFAGVLFYDTAAAFDGFEAMRPLHTAGIGARLLFSQFERRVLRFDYGFPLNPTPDLAAKKIPGDFVLTFGQAY